MDLMFKEQKTSTYDNLDVNKLYYDLMQSILFETTREHEKRLNDAESEIKKLIHFNDQMTNDNQFLSNGRYVRPDDYINRRIEDKFTGRDLETITSELKAAEDKKLQIQIVGELVDEIKGMLKDIPKQKNNYRRQMLLMFHEALKQNYTKKLFNETQVMALIEVARVCSKSFITKEQYFKMDDILCECDLDMMPELE